MKLCLALMDETKSNIESFLPQLILLDVFIGSSSGIHICKELKADPGKKHIPIIMFSSQASAETIKECPADDFIAKPFAVNNLISKIELAIKNYSVLN